MCYCNNTFFRLCLIGVPFFQLLIYNYAFQYQTFFDISYLSSKSFIITINYFYPYWVGVSILLITYSIFSIQILIKFFVLGYWVAIGWVGLVGYLFLISIYLYILLKYINCFQALVFFLLYLLQFPSYNAICLGDSRLLETVIPNNQRLKNSQ